MNPLARKSDIFAEHLPEEVVLYDKSGDKVHCLNKTSAAIWESCDGSRSVDELMSVVAAKLGAPVDRDVVLLALEELEKADLLEVGAPAVADAALASRREAMSRIALGGTALVATMIAAAPAAHASFGDPKGDDPNYDHHHKHDDHDHH